MTTRLKVFLSEKVSENISKVFLWTDSKTFLNYLRNENRNFGAFIAHRVNEMRNDTTFDDWHYVPTEENIADFTIRYLGIPQLIKIRIGFTGQVFYRFSSSTLLATAKFSKQFDEYRRCKHYYKMNHDGCSNEVEINWTYYFSLPTLVRQFSWILK